MNAIRQVVIANSLTSWAWISPEGKIYELPGHMNHMVWAEKHLGHEDGAMGVLAREGWLHASNPFGFGFHKTLRNPPDKAIEAFIDNMIMEIHYGDFKTANPEWDKVMVSHGNKVDYIIIADFIKKYGTRQQMDVLFEGLL